MASQTLPICGHAAACVYADLVLAYGLALEPVLDFLEVLP